MGSENGMQKATVISEEILNLPTAKALKQEIHQVSLSYRISLSVYDIKMLILPVRFTLKLKMSVLKSFMVANLPSRPCG